MAFPMSSQGLIRTESTDFPQTMKAVEGLLRETRASEIAVESDRIDFTVRFLRLVSNWNLLVPIDSGTIAFRQSDRAVEIHYFISFKRFFFIVTSMLIAVFAGLSAVDPRMGLVVIGFAWLWLFGLNYFIAILRFPAALRSSVRRNDQGAVLAKGT